MEAFLPFRHASHEVPPVSAVRSTIVVSAIQTLRAQGHFDRYVAVLSPELREQLLSLVAGAWLPIDVALAHYRAVDRLALPPAVIEAIGGEVAERINKSVISIAVTLSKRAGVTPWSALSISHRINDMNWRGGDVAVWRAGPKDAIYDWTGQPCASVPYFVTSFGGFLVALASLFSSKSYARVVRERCRPMTLSYRLSWV